MYNFAIMPFTSILFGYNKEKLFILHPPHIENQNNDAHSDK